MGEVTIEFLRAFCAVKLKDESLIERNLEATIARMLFMLGTFYKIRSGYVVVFVITLGGGGGTCVIHKHRSRNVATSVGRNPQVYWG